MSLLDGIKRAFGVKPVNIGALNRRATSPYGKPAVRLQSDPLNGVVVTEGYRHVQALIDGGAPMVFVTGNAGSGKSTLIRYLSNTLTQRLAVVAPTGVAALNVGGATIHSFFRLAPKIHGDGDIKRLTDRTLYTKLEVLIVDEASMVRADLLDSIDRFLRLNRDSTEPFGGVQILLVGDLFQLPPVVPREEKRVLAEKGYLSPYFFSAFSVQALDLIPFELQTQFRQEDAGFLGLLDSVRLAEDLDDVLPRLNARVGCQADGSDLTLTCTNAAADAINMRELGALRGEERVYPGAITGRFNIGTDKLPSPIDLKLKVGAHVMFTKNDEKRRWVNGSLGVVRALDSGAGIRVEMLSESRGQIHEVGRATWHTFGYRYDSASDSIVSEQRGDYVQYPLALAWAVTIHKSQGKTLDQVFIDLGGGAFESGQVYVALSRCRELEGICLARELRGSDIICDPLIRDFYLTLHDLSQQGADEQAQPFPPQPPL